MAAKCASPAPPLGEKHIFENQTVNLGDGQGEALRKLFFDAGFDDIRIEKDYAGHDRYASAVLP